MPQAEAKALLPSLTTEWEDLEADREVLRTLAAWSERFSPVISLEDALAPSSLFVDVTGGDACFGGEESLLRQACQAYGEHGWHVHLALADTVGAAWAVARFGSQKSPSEKAASFELLNPPNAMVRHETETPNKNRMFLLPPGSHEQGLMNYPLASLRVPESAVHLLGQLGITRIGQLSALPRVQVAERFGASVLRQLDRMLGNVSEALEPYHAKPEAVASLAFDYPIQHRTAVEAALDTLLIRLETILEKRQLGGRAFECWLFQEDMDPLCFECNVSRPSRNAAYVGKLLHAKLEGVRLSAPIMGMQLFATITEPFHPAQGNLFEVGEPVEMSELSRLLDDLANRLGPSSVMVAEMVADPLPELACRLTPAVSAAEKPPPKPVAERRRGNSRALTPSPFGGGLDVYEYVSRYRPLHVLPRPISIDVIALAQDEPKQFRHAGVEHTILQSLGPERIEAGWWRDHDARRDYYLVETTEGSRWWIFRSLHDGQWFLQGEYE